MEKYLYVLFCLFIITGCRNKETSESIEDTGVFYYVNNKILEREITYFLDSVKPNNNYMINVSVLFSADTAIYDIRYCLNAEDIYNTPSTFFVNIKSKVISITYEEPKTSIAFAHLNGVRMSEKDAWRILKCYYPEEYTYYLRTDSIVYAITTGGGEVWRLKFKNDEFLGKEVFFER